MRGASTTACVILLYTLAGPAMADDVPSLPLGDPQRAYLMASGDAGQIIDCRLPADPKDPAAKRAKPVEMKDLIADLATADVVIIGEQHTSLPCHQTQWKVVEGLIAAGRPVALGMEFFDVTADETLKAYWSGSMDLNDMLQKSGWLTGGNYNFEYYKPMFEACRAQHAPIYGVNIPRDWVRTVSRSGVDGLPEGQRQYIGEVGPIDERHKYAVNQMMGGLGASMPEMFDGMYRGQTTWDASMANSIVRACKAHKQQGTPRTMVIIVGSGHMAHGLGIPGRLKTMDPSLVVRTMAPVSAHKPQDDEVVHPGFEKKESAVFSRGYADYAFILPDDGGEEAFPQIGVRLDHPKGATSPTATPLVITGVSPGGIAERAGLKKGDEVLSIGTEKPMTPAQAGAVLGSMRFDERVEWSIIRPGSGPMTVPMVVTPTTDGDLDWLKSRPASGMLDTFDPSSVTSYALPDKKLRPEAPNARIVTFRDKAVRIDIVRGTTLIQTWKLDDAGRPVMGILAEPAADGAVRIQLERDASGKVTSTKRMNSRGEPIEAGSKANPHGDVNK